MPFSWCPSRIYLQHPVRDSTAYTVPEIWKESTKSLLTENWRKSEKFQAKKCVRTSQPLTFTQRRSLSLGAEVEQFTKKNIHKYHEVRDHSNFPPHYCQCFLYLHWGGGTICGQLLLRLQLSQPKTWSWVHCQEKKEAWLLHFTFHSLFLVWPFLALFLTKSTFLEQLYHQKGFPPAELNSLQATL